MADTSDPMTEEAFQVWLQSLIEQYPQVGAVYLAGSRAAGSHKTDSDYDLIVCLPDDLYDLEGDRLDDTELKIALATRRPSLDIFFLRPKGDLHRYNLPAGFYSGEISDKDWIWLISDCGSRELAIYSIMDGYLFGDFDRLSRSLKDAKQLYCKEAISG